ILKADLPDLAAALAAHGVRLGRPLGFRNNYALGMRKDVAAAKGITKISDLRGHPDLRLGFVHEFLDRPDGWPGVKRHYDLPQTNVQGMNHTLAYRALVERAIDVTEVYTTDGEIAQYDLLVLPDDKNFFPAYEAVWLYRADLGDRHPAVVDQLRRLEGRVSEPQMQRMNAAVQEGKREEGAVWLFMIPVMRAVVGKGTGAPPAIAALFLYSLLPIVRNTHAGLTGIPASLRESAEALGLPPWAVLWRVELPLAAPTILAGVRT